MSLNAAAIAVMVERGLSAADILAVAEALEIKRDSTGAERQARYRDRKAAEVTRNVTRDDVTQQTPCPPTPPLKVSPDPFKITPPIPPTPNPICADGRFVLPDDIPAQPFAAFVEMRKSIGKKMTDHAKHLAVVKLRKLRDDDGWPPGEVLNHSTLNSYQGLFPPQKDRNNGHSRSQPTGIGTTERAMQKALASLEGRGAGAGFAS